MKTFINHWTFAVVFAAIVFGSTAYVAYNTAVDLHTTGSQLIGWFLK